MYMTYVNKITWIVYKYSKTINYVSMLKPHARKVKFER